MVLCARFFLFALYYYLRCLYWWWTYNNRLFFLRYISFPLLSTFFFRHSKDLQVFFFANDSFLRVMCVRVSMPSRIPFSHIWHLILMVSSFFFCFAYSYGVHGTAPPLYIFSSWFLWFLWFLLPFSSALRLLGAERRGEKKKQQLLLSPFLLGGHCFALIPFCVCALFFFHGSRQLLLLDQLVFFSGFQDDKGCGYVRVRCSSPLSFLHTSSSHCSAAFDTLYPVLFSYYYYFFCDIVSSKLIMRQQGLWLLLLLLG